MVPTADARNQTQSDRSNQFMAPTAQRTFLIMDASEIDRALIRRHLEQAGISTGLILEAAGAREAIDLLGAVRVDLVLLNVNVPEQPVGELLAQLRELTRFRASFVLLIDEGFSVQVIDLYKQGAKGHLRKPFTASELRVVLERILV